MKKIGKTIRAKTADGLHIAQIPHFKPLRLVIDLNCDDVQNHSLTL